MISCYSYNYSGGIMETFSEDANSARLASVEVHHALTS